MKQGYNFSTIYKFYRQVLLPSKSSQKNLRTLQFQTAIKSELFGISIRGKRDLPRIVCIYSKTHETKQSG